MSNFQYFVEKSELETQAWPSVLSWLKECYGLSAVADVRGNVEYQKRDIDLLTRNSSGFYSVEVKVRARDYGDLLIETMSNVEKGSIGNFYVSQADYLAYVVFQDGELAPAYLFHLPSLRTWFDKNKKRYRTRRAPNPPDKPVFHSEFCAVLFSDIPLYCHVPKEP